MAWQIKSVGNVSGVLKDIESAVSTPAGDPQLAAAKILLAAELKTVKTNGVRLIAEGDSQDHHRAISIQIFPMKLTIAN